MRKLSFGLLSIFFCLALSGFAPVLADENMAIRKLNLVNLQALLGQRIAKSTCLIATYKDPAKQAEILQKSGQFFERNLRILIKGSTRFDIEKERNPQALSEIQKISETWDKIKFASDVLLDMKEYPDFDAGLIFGLNIGENIAFSALQEEYGKETSITTYATLTQSARLATLTQKASKEFCLVSYGWEVSQNRNRLAQSMQEFDQIIEDLIMGNEAFNIIKPPSSEIVEAIQALKQQWQAPRAIMQASSNGEMIKARDFDGVSRANDQMMRASRKIADLYLRHYRLGGPDEL